MIGLFGDISDGDLLDTLAVELGLASQDWVKLTAAGSAVASASSAVFAAAKAQYSIRCWKFPESTGFRDNLCGIIVYIHDGKLVIDQMDALELNDPCFIDKLKAIIDRFREFGAFSYDRYAIEKWRPLEMQRVGL